MRVLHFFKTYLPDSFGGVEHVIWQIAEGCAKLGIASEVLSLSADPKCNSVALPHHFAHKAALHANVASTGLSLSAFRSFKRLAESADIVHYHFPWPYMDFVHFVSRVGRPSVLTYHSDIVRQRRLLKLYAPLMHAFLGSVDRIVATSPDYLASSPVLSRYRAKTSVIPIGLDPNEFVAPSVDVQNRWRQRFGTRFFLFIGALRYYKGLPFLIEAARSTGYPVVVAGEGEMQTALDNAGVDNLHSIGRVSDEDRSALLQLATAFVFPSHLRSEAFGVALLEAAFAGKALISCELGTGTSFINQNGVTGLTVRAGDPIALATAMTQVWNNPGMTKSFGAAAKERAWKLFTAESMASSYADLYEEVLREAVFP